jgi:Domain of unknown function (DUF4406)
MRLVFVAGPYRAPNEYLVLKNIRRAEELAIRVWHSGAACICPHKNTAFFGGAASDKVWLDGALEMVRRCDAVICTSNWRESSGATGEVQLAKNLGIPVFEEYEELERWLKESRDPAEK